MKGVLHKDVDVESMFEKFSVEDIRAIEKKTRLDIEGKKEELRQMVGERYRDLIEAADTISEMKRSTDSVLRSVGRMQDLCQQLPQTAGLPRAKASTDKSNGVQGERNFFAIAAQMKLLIDIPDKIWRDLDQGRYVHACQLYLLACHIHTGLQVDPAWSNKISAAFPVVAHQWTIIRLFHGHLLELCRITMARCSLTDQVVAECVCVIMLLTDKTPTQILAEFLEARLRAISQSLEDGDAGVKGQLADVTTVVVDTVHQVHNIFSSGASDGGLLYKLARTLSEKEGVILNNNSDLNISNRYLPSSIIDFRPMFKQAISVLPSSELLTSCQQWLARSTSDVHAGAKRLLQFVSSNKALATIRGDIRSVLAADARVSQWTDVCSHLIGREVDVWEELLQHVFTERTKELLDNQLSSGVELVYQQVSQALRDMANTKDRQQQYEKDLPSYVWQEASHDIAAGAAWTTVSMRQVGDTGTLAMKARAYSPVVQSLCKTLDSRYQLVLEECKYHLVSASANEIASVSSVVQSDILSFVQTASQASMNALLSRMQSDVTACGRDLSSANSEAAVRQLIDRVLLIARFASAVSQLCPNLRQCLAVESNTAKTDDKLKAQQARRSVSVAPNQSADSPQWAELKTRLQQFSKETYEIWLSRIVAALKADLNKQLRALCDHSNMHGLLKWDDIEINETTDDGKSVKSVIRVPMQASACVQGALYQLCGEINRTSCHALNRSLVQELAERTALAMVEVYEGVVSASAAGVNQNSALQWLFDLRFIAKVVPRSDASEASFQAQWRPLVDKLESVIDPFDLDVFLPHMHTRLSQHVQQCSLLYGALVSLDKHSVMTMSSSSRLVTSAGGQQDQHNVLWLSSTSNRFTLLPLSVSSRQQATPLIVQPPKAKAVGDATLLSQPSQQQQTGGGNKMTRDNSTSNFLGQWGSMWFSNADGKTSQ